MVSFFFLYIYIFKKTDKRVFRKLFNIRHVNLKEAWRWLILRRITNTKTSFFFFLFFAWLYSVKGISF